MKTFLANAISVIGAGLVLAVAAYGGQLPTTTVDFGPHASDELQRYGAEEAAVLRSAILAAVSRESGRLTIPQKLAVTVTVQDIAPTRPTRKQSLDDPSLDPVLSKTQGGAELTGYVRDASQRVVVSVHYRHFAPTLVLGSASLDPWADALLAIEQFAVKLAAVCRDLPQKADPAT